MLGTVWVIRPQRRPRARRVMVCSIILTQAQFRNEGYPNCPFLDLKSSPDAIESCTSRVYEGATTIADPKKSWVARWQRLDKYIPGIYAIKVSGIRHCGYANHPLFFFSLRKRRTVITIRFTQREIL
ncbi:Spt4/RpoE2 zinc finger-domain-containing protein [Xylariomycetidae sp. FL2044]|nr:Spt4/RpoE2 zinc finger-domain-containing protein [Xylariomycetidae sp. FL2044]